MRFHDVVIFPGVPIPQPLHIVLWIRYTTANRYTADSKIQPMMAGISDMISYADMMVKALKDCAPMICHLTSPRGDVHFRNKSQEQLRAQFSSFEVGHKYSLASEYLFSFMFSCILSNLNFWYEHQEKCTLEQICLMSKQLISIGVSGYIENINSD